MKSIMNKTSLVFPDYSIFSSPISVNTEEYSNYIKQTLPKKIELAKSMDQTFRNFLNKYKTILKKPHPEKLISTFLSKLSERLQNFFSQTRYQFSKMQQKQLDLHFRQLNLQYLRHQFRDRLKCIQQVLTCKYFQNYCIDAQSQQQIVRRLTYLFELYQFLMGPPKAYINQFFITDCEIMKVMTHYTKSDSNIILNCDQLMLNPEFTQIICQKANRKSYSHQNKRNSLQSKTKEILRHIQSKTGTNYHFMLDTILKKQKIRIQKTFYDDLTKEFKNTFATFHEDDNMQIKQIMNEVNKLNLLFVSLKNNTHYYDVVGFTFLNKHRLELNKIQNLHYLANLDTYLNKITEFMEKLLKLEQIIIENSKNYIKQFGHKMQVVIHELVDRYEARHHELKCIPEIINEEFNALEHGLCNIVQCPPPNPEYCQYEYQQKAYYLQKQAEQRQKIRRNYLEQQTKKMQQQRKKAQKQKREQQLQRQSEKRKQLQKQKQQQKLKNQKRQQQENQRNRKLKEIKKLLSEI